MRVGVAGRLTEMKIKVASVLEDSSSYKIPILVVISGFFLAVVITC